MPSAICTACGIQFPDAALPPGCCPICEDSRQFVPPTGQSWTTMDALAKAHRNAYRRYEADLIGVGTSPRFGIGQRALLLRHPEGNLLWDCITLLDDATVEIVRALGGIRAIAISHPHYYTTMVEWAHAFGAEVHLHAADRAWVMRPDPALRFWTGDRMRLWGDLELLRVGGHFTGGTVLHAPRAAEGRGALLSGDIIQVAPDRRSTAFMWSYPNYIPLAASAVRRIGCAVEALAFDRVYGAFWDSNIERAGKAAVARSVERYLHAIGDGPAGISDGNDR